jgi:hypothetical protein
LHKTRSPLRYHAGEGSFFVSGGGTTPPVKSILKIAKYLKAGLTKCSRSVFSSFPYPITCKLPDEPEGNQRLPEVQGKTVGGYKIFLKNLQKTLDLPVW